MMHMATQEQCDRFNRECHEAADNAPSAPPVAAKSKDDLAHRFTQHGDSALRAIVEGLNQKRDAKIARLEKMVEADEMDAAFAHARKKLGLGKTENLKKGAI
ncbi:MAG: hypothetical protein NTX50_22115 [Candidatus Sumerlaeota bacterium]|nr:hypothetical protein [Candidatus Sumerlaeota bacterium]